ncbi:MAG: AlkA N-terminal domain-containing protein [bacterium]|nr:AlkA N-terminal domain-containing protein [bacterium]
MIPPREACIAAVASRDARFDGVFYTGVISTGIFCRPSCPAMTPRPANLTFHPSAAAATADGFRACRRCRPDATPGSPEWDIRADTAGRALRLIADGAVDRGGISGLAAHLGYSPRQLERLTRAEMGASPLALARTQRAVTARILVETTDLPFSDVAFAAGFGSIRSFNDTIRTVFAATPFQLRARRPRRHLSPASGPSSTPTAELTVRLPVRLPWDPEQSFAHLVATAVPGIEEWTGTHYRRTLRLPRGPGIVSIAPRETYAEATFHLTDLRDLQAATARTRRMLDLDADPAAVADHLGRDPHLAASVAASPGRRIPRSADGSEMALRAVLGQQVSTAAARTHTARIVERLGDPLPHPDGTLTHLFPTPEVIAEADLPGLPAGRAATLRALANALAEGTIDVGPGADRAETRARLAELPGIGPWTVELVAMRALGDPDAFPATDLGVIRGAANLGIPGATARELIASAERWRPWRSYAVQYLWAAHEHPTNHLPVGTPSASSGTPSRKSDAPSREGRMNT